MRIHVKQYGGRAFALCLFLFLYVPSMGQTQQDLAQEISSDGKLVKVSSMAEELIKTGFTAGSGYGEVWIRDFNTFIELSCKVLPIDSVKRQLLVFFQMQGKDGNIVDGYIPIEKADRGYEYIYSTNAPDYAGHKNTVETDQETSLIQAVYTYVKTTKDTGFLSLVVDEKNIHTRMEEALQFLMKERYDARYGLIYGATTVDWGDVQPETPWGVRMDSSSHLAIDVYDNAMLIIALNNYLELFPDDADWKKVRKQIRKNIRKHLWDKTHQKFRPHIYLKDSPFPESFDENEVNYHGGTAVAIKAGLLSKREVAAVNEKMLQNVKASGAASIGLTIYPPYPEGFFKNKSMSPYSYQNGGDWTWFGARMITELVRHGFVREAYEEIQPMLDRVIENQGFYEWYTPDNKPSGSGHFRGSAGALYTAIDTMREWADGVLMQYE